MTIANRVSLLRRQILVRLFIHRCPIEGRPPEKNDIDDCTCDELVGEAAYWDNVTSLTARALSAKFPAEIEADDDEQRADYYEDYSDKSRNDLIPADLPCFIGSARREATLEERPCPLSERRHSADAEVPRKQGTAHSE